MTEWGEDDLLLQNRILRERIMELHKSHEDEIMQKQVTHRKEITHLQVKIGELQAQLDLEQQKSKRLQEDMKNRQHSLPIRQRHQQEPHEMKHEKCHQTIEETNGQELHDNQQQLERRQPEPQPQPQILRHQHQPARGSTSRLANDTTTRNHTNQERPAAILATDPTTCVTPDRGESPQGNHMIIPTTTQPHLQTPPPLAASAMRTSAGHTHRSKDNNLPEEENNIRQDNGEDDEMDYTHNVLVPVKPKRTTVANKAQPKHKEALGNSKITTKEYVTSPVIRISKKTSADKRGGEDEKEEYSYDDDHGGRGRGRGSNGDGDGNGAIRRGRAARPPTASKRDLAQSFYKDDNDDDDDNKYQQVFHNNLGMEDMVSSQEFLDDDSYVPGEKLDDYAVWDQKRRSKSIDKRKRAARKSSKKPDTKARDSPEQGGKKLCPTDYLYNCPVAGCPYSLPFSRFNHPPRKDGEFIDPSLWPEEFAPQASTVEKHMKEHRPPRSLKDPPKGAVADDRGNSNNASTKDASAAFVDHARGVGEAVVAVKSENTTMSRRRSLLPAPWKDPETIQIDDDNDDEDADCDRI